jgi:hypothetical protein
MADLTFAQQLVRDGVQALAVALGGGLSLAVGWRLLRRQERIKRDEEIAAGLRKVQTDALVRALAALGRFHNLKAKRFTWERQANTREDRDFAASVKNQEADAFTEVINVIAEVHFLLGGQLGQLVRRGLIEMGKAQTPDASEEAAAQLETALAGWLPPLDPLERPSGGTREASTEQVSASAGRTPR